MNETVEQSLRVALADLAASRPTDADARLCARDYLPRTRRRPRWPLAGAAATLLGTGAATAAVLLSSTAPEAFAGWTAVPAAATPSALRTATALCNAMNPPSGRLTGRAVLTEARGKFVAEIYVNRSTGWDHVCISDGVWGDSGTSVGSGQAALMIRAAPGPDQLGMPDEGAGFADGFPGAADRYKGQQPLWASHLSAAQRAAMAGSAQHWAGLAGRDVRSVTFEFDRGVTVNATVQNGWYFAWWPGPALPNTIQVTTSTGTITNSPVPGTATFNKACPNRTQSSRSKCGAFATGERPSAIRRQQAWRRAHPNRTVSRAPQG